MEKMPLEALKDGIMIFRIFQVMGGLGIVVGLYYVLMEKNEFSTNILGPLGIFFLALATLFNSGFCLLAGDGERFFIELFLAPVLVVVGIAASAVILLLLFKLVCEALHKRSHRRWSNRSCRRYKLPKRKKPR